jgi:acid phosphatase
MGQALIQRQGITLTNYNGVTHPSQPNYVASVGGDNFGLDSDNEVMIPANVSTIVDLLEAKGISWGEYLEDIPSDGYTGSAKTNSKGANDYVRKHK